MYSDYLHINKNFQSSINLELDFGKVSKIEQYIPTSDICDVLKKYIKTILGRNNDRATTLIGSYGKGKSFLLLILSFIFSKNKSSKAWNDLYNKINKVDNELGNLILELKSKDISLLPVFINSNYDNVTQSFLIALNDTLRRAGLDNLIPKSTFDVCLNLLKKREKTSKLKDEIFSKCLQVNNINVNELKKGLNEFSTKAYRQFEKLYNCVNIGLEFNPLVNNDVVKIYFDVSKQIKIFGYNGIFIIFDEFSKFLESNSEDVMKDLKIIQDFAELASRSDYNSQVHLCCVAHKSLSLYKSNKKYGFSNDSFKTVEGRFKEIRFNRSINENYQIISHAIIKSDGAEEYICKYINDNRKFYNSIRSLPLFNSKNLEKDLFIGCFPLNPITAYALIRVSELVAQNERTLFTFISDTDEESLNTFICGNSDGLLNVDRVYDYFSNILKNEETNSIRNIWYRVESILSRVGDFIEKRIIKALSIILMIDDFDIFPPSEKIISLSLDLPLDETTKAINSLINKHLLRRNILSNLLSFALSNTKQIDQLLEVYKETKFKDLKFSQELNSIKNDKFVLPRKYNENNKITRFYNVLFMTEDEFKQFSSLKYYFETYYCDGLIIYLLREKLTKSQILGKIKQFNDNRIIAKYPKEIISSKFYDLITNHAALNEVKKQKGLDEITINEIDLLLDETKDDIKSLIDNYFEENFDFVSLLFEKRDSFNFILSKTMEDTYSIKLIFNNELINKRNVSSQYQKAINHVIDWMLCGYKEFNYSITSPESSVKYAVLDNNNNDSVSSHNFRKIVDELKNKIISLNGEKKKVYDIISDLSAPPYGIRKGIIPVLLSKAISELSDNVILYYSLKEIELNSENIVKSIDNENYKISCLKGSKEQKEYLDYMISLFSIGPTNNFRKDTILLANGIKKFYIGLPQIIRTCDIKDNYLHLNEDFIYFKDVFLSFDLNPFDSLFNLPLKRKSEYTYKDIENLFSYYVKNQDSLLNYYKDHIVSSVKELFEIELNTSIRSGLSDYLKTVIKNDLIPILDEKNKEIFNFIKVDLSYDDYECIEKLCKICTGQFIEDWDYDRSRQVIEILAKFKESLFVATKIDGHKEILNLSEYSNTNISGMASLLKNNLESVLEEFSDSVNSKDKIAVLINLLKDMF